MTKPPWRLLARFVAAERSGEFVCVGVKSWMGTLRRFLTAAGHLHSADVEPDHPTPV